MNPIEILEILAIAVHSFSEMPGLGQTLLRTVQMSAAWLGAGAHAARQRPHSEDQSNIDKTEEKSEKITLCRSLYRESGTQSRPAAQLSCWAPGLLAN